MGTLIEILAGLAILANAVIYGTDVFGAIVLRPAIAAVDDRTLTQLLGHVHRIAGRRFAAIGTGGLIAALAMPATLDYRKSEGYQPLSRRGSGAREELAARQETFRRSAKRDSLLQRRHWPYPIEAR